MVPSFTILRVRVSEERRKLKATTIPKTTRLEMSDDVTGLVSGSRSTREKPGGYQKLPRNSLLRVTPDPNIAYVSVLFKIPTSQHKRGGTD
jgi:hypothetical protein